MESLVMVNYIIHSSCSSNRLWMTVFELPSTFSHFYILPSHFNLQRLLMLLFPHAFTYCMGSVTFFPNQSGLVFNTIGKYRQKAVC